MSPAPRIGLIWAQATGGLIGRAGGMPWHVPEDLAHFRAVTAGHPVVMGRSTWDSLDPRYRPLPGRRNIVVTRNDDWAADGAERAGTLDGALGLARADRPEWIWIIGGGDVFAQTIAGADRLEVTELEGLELEGTELEADGSVAREGDVRAPSIDPALFERVDAEPAQTSRTGIRYRFVRYDRASS